MVRILTFIVSTSVWFILAVPGYAQKPGDLETGCLDDQELADGQYDGTYMLFNESNPASGIVNVREQPTTRSAIVYAAQSQNPIAVSQQVFQEDGYCWLRADVTSLTNTTASGIIVVTGWIRGDLITTAWD